jgi:hypothetical protein
MKQFRITRQQLEQAAKLAVLRVDNARRRYDLARAELDEALQDAAVSSERLRFSDVIGGHPTPKTKEPNPQEQPS